MNSDITTQRLDHTLTAASRAARANGALAPIETRAETLLDGRIAFTLRTVSSLARKSAAPRAATMAADPFAPPYEQDLYVGPIAPAHAGLLNKFPVLPDHLLIVTREWAAQQAPLGAADFEAALRVLGALDGLLFYNSGPTAGASQAHRHLQFVLPPEPLALPRRLDPERGHCHDWPFAHAAAPVAAAWLDDPVTGASALARRYLSLLVAVGRDGTQPGAAGGAYNLLMTRTAIWLVPRVAEYCGPVGVNALGFAGLLLAADAEQADFVRRTGPCSILAAVAGRPTAAQRG